jgi:hypothetical protein
LVQGVSGVRVQFHGACKAGHASVVQELSNNIQDYLYDILDRDSLKGSRSAKARALFATAETQMG